MSSVSYSSVAGGQLLRCIAFFSFLWMKVKMQLTAPSQPTGKLSPKFYLFELPYKRGDCSFSSSSRRHLGNLSVFSSIVLNIVKHTNILIK